MSPLEDGTKSMCLILLAYQVHPRYPLVLAANRDELYARPTAPASFWEDAPDLLAGRDLQQGGSWLGVNRDGRVAAVTNLRDGRPFRDDAPSRGRLVSDFLAGDAASAAYREDLKGSAPAYNGFNLVFGDDRDGYFYCNSAGSAVALGPGVHGVSNHPLETPWPKTLRGKRLLAERVAGSFSEEDLLDILADSTAPGDAGSAVSPHEGETADSPIFIRSDSFGTRCSTVVLIDREGVLTFVERTFHQDVAPSTVRVQFDLPRRPR